MPILIKSLLLPVRDSRWPALCAHSWCLSSEVRGWGPGGFPCYHLPSSASQSWLKGICCLFSGTAPQSSLWSSHKWEGCCGLHDGDILSGVQVAAFSCCIFEKEPPSRSRVCQELNLLTATKGWFSRVFWNFREFKIQEVKGVEGRSELNRDVAG